MVHQFPTINFTEVDLLFLLWDSILINNVTCLMKMSHWQFVKTLIILAFNETMGDEKNLEKLLFF